jgi:hypothetical protein
MKNAPTLADACIASLFDKRMYGAPGERTAAHRPLLRDVAAARKFVLDGPMSRYLADLSEDFWRGGLRKRLRMLENARQLARAPHALTWIEYSYGAHYIKRIIEKGGQGVAGIGGQDPQRMGWLIRQHATNAAAFMACEIRSTIGIPDRAFIHPVGMAWCADDAPSPWPRFPPQSVFDDYLGAAAAKIGWGSEGVVEMTGYRSTQAHWHAFLGDAMTTAMIETMMGKVANEDQIAAAGKPAVSLRALWALLATINDLPVVIESIEPSKGYVSRGSYKKFVTHSVIHLTVPETRWYKITNKVAAILRRRAHQVRGHWRIDWRARPIKGCEHEWDAEMTCRKCGGHQLWISEHQRGDASLGFVIHDYDITTNKQSAVQ